MILLFVSFFVIFLSSYLLTGILDRDNSAKGFMYLLLIAFAQIILTFEILSPFSAITKQNVIISNFMFLILAITLWLKFKKPLWSANINPFLKHFFNALKLDKTLIILLLGWVIFLAVSLFLVTIFPITNGDARSYHVVRSVLWVLNGSINHPIATDIRIVSFPINSEIIYSWVILFTQKNMLLGYFALSAYFLAMIGIYNLLALIGFSMRKKLWTLLILSSFACVLTQAAGSETDLVIASLIITSIYLFWISLKTDKKIPLFMAALAYALAIGTKTTALIAIPATTILILYLCHLNKNFKYFFYFIFFGVINFFIFSSYNYILNYLDYNNIISSPYAISVHSNVYGIKGTFASIIRHLFLFIDFTGLRWSEYLNHYILSFKDQILSFLHLAQIPEGIFSKSDYGINRSLAEPYVGCGILGFTMFLPCCFYALLKPLFSKSKKVQILSIFAATLLINLFTLSYTVAFMIFNVRFITTFIVIASPILVYTYMKNKNPLKYIVILFALYYFILVNMNWWNRSFIRIMDMMINHKESISQIRYRADCLLFAKVDVIKNSTCMIGEIIDENFKTPPNKILFLHSSSTDILRLKLQEFNGVKYELAALNDYEKIPFDDYNLIIIDQEGQWITNFKNYTPNDIQYDIKTVNEQTEFIYKTNAESVCYYLTTKEPRFIAKNNNNINEKPYSVQCAFTPIFFQNHHFEELIKVKSYTFYTNKLNPPTYTHIRQTQSN